MGWAYRWVGFNFGVDGTGSVGVVDRPFPSPFPFSVIFLSFSGFSSLLLFKGGLVDGGKEVKFGMDVLGIFLVHTVFFPLFSSLLGLRLFGFVFWVKSYLR